MYKLIYTHIYTEKTHEISVHTYIYILLHYIHIILRDENGWHRFYSFPNTCDITRGSQGADFLYCFVLRSHFFKILTLDGAIP